MPSLREWLLRCKEDLAQKDLDRLLEDFRHFQALPLKGLSLEEARECAALLEELLLEAEALRADYETGLSGLSEIRERLHTFFQQLRYLLLSHNL